MPGWPRPGWPARRRSRGLCISTSTYGVLVLADRGEEAVQAAGVAAVLLASRLAVPAAPASLDDPAGIDAAAVPAPRGRRERPIIAPCLIGPETPQRELDDGQHRDRRAVLRRRWARTRRSASSWRSGTAPR